MSSRRYGGVEPSGNEASVPQVVEQAIRIRMAWEEVSLTHWGHPGSEPTPAPCCRAVRPVSAPREAWHA